jgi:hypothetical protein
MWAASRAVMPVAPDLEMSSEPAASNAATKNQGAARAKAQPEAWCARTQIDKSQGGGQGGIVEFEFHNQGENAVCAVGHFVHLGFRKPFPQRGWGGAAPAM